MRRMFITGTGGFIGYHLARRLLDEGFRVGGYDGMTEYYDVGLKRRRHQLLRERGAHPLTEAMLEDNAKLWATIEEFSPEVIVHLAAQAGVRYSLENPRCYIDSNVIGTFNILEAARKLKVNHLLIASTSSVYGGNEDMPFKETQKADTQLTIYAATKKANESMAHAYAHLWDLPTTVFRFFTVYGPWGRPDMALFKFADAIMEGRPIEIYNNGDMYRDFTYVDDLVAGIRLLVDVVPSRPTSAAEIAPGDSLSPVAPFRIVNIGNSTKIRLLEFVEAIEAELGRKAIRKYMPMQMGDVPSTWADVTLLQLLTDCQPQTNIREGIARFVKWFREYYEK